MALVPIIQPPIMKLLTTRSERVIRMQKGRKVKPLEKIVFPIVAAIVIILLVPASAPLVAMFMLGNLFREAKVVERLTHASQNELLNIVTIFLGLPVGATMNAENFLQPKVIFIFFLGLSAFMFSTATGILLAKLMNLFSRNKINPLLGAAGVSAVPMAARVVHKVAAEADKKNYLLMYAMGPQCRRGDRYGGGGRHIFDAVGLRDQPQSLRRQSRLMKRNSKLWRDLKWQKKF